MNTRNKSQILLPETHIAGIWAPASAADKRDKPAPLLVCIHGGGYSSMYFDIPGASMIEAASQAGFNAVSFDRPDHGSSARLAKGEQLITRNAQALWRAIDELIKLRAPGTREIVLVGHSIGGAIAICMAGQAPERLRGLAVSGIGLVVTHGAEAQWNWIPPVRKLPMPRFLIFNKLFGPKGTYDPQLAKLSLDLALNWPVRQELMEISTWWFNVIAPTCAAVKVPIDISLGEFETMWDASSDNNVQRFAELFVNSPQVAATRIAQAGHCIDHHLVGRQFQAHQLAFLSRACNTVEVA